MSFSSFVSDPIATRDRGEWFIILYPRDTSLVEVPLRFSYRGTSTGAANITIGSDTILAHTPFRKRVIDPPDVTQSLWQSGKMLSSSFPSPGSIKLHNADGGLDQYSSPNSYIWGGSRIQVYFLDYSDIPNTIGKVFDGYMGDPDFSLPEVNIPLKSREDLFSVPISNRVYRGTGYMLELSGARTADFGTPSAVNLTGSMTVECWIWMDAAGASNARNIGWYGGSRSPWGLNINVADRTLAMRAHVSGVGEGANTTASLSLQVPYHISCVISGQDVTFYIWDDDTQVLTTETFTNYFSSSIRDANVGGTYRVECTGTRVIWYDELRVWNYARTLTEIEADRFRELSTIPATCVHYVKFNDGSGTTAVDSSATAANGTIAGAGTSTWLWSNEGGPELAGTPKPDVWGERWGVAPVLVDPVRQGYQYAGGGGTQDVTTYEGGLSHTMDASSASYRAYLTTTPAAGHSLRYLPRGLFKLGSQPILPISAYVKGYNGGALGYINKGDTIIRDIVTRRGPKLVDPTDLDTSSFTAYATANPGILGIALYQPESVNTILDKLVGSGSGWWGYVRAINLFHIEKFSGPAVTADYNFTQRQIISIEPLKIPSIIYEVIVKYRENNVVHSEDQVAASVKSTANWTQWTQAWQEQKRSDGAIRRAFPGSASVPVTFETCLQYATDAGQLADYIIAAIKGPRSGWALNVTATGLQVKAGQTCTLSVELQSGSDERLGLTGVDKYIILTVGDRQASGIVRLEVWK